MDTIKVERNLGEVTPVFSPYSYLLIDERHEDRDTMHEHRPL